MNYGVKSQKNIVSHFYAKCKECDFHFDNHHLRELGRKEIKKHVKDTGHTVLVEMAVAEHYEAVKDDCICIK